MKLEALKAAVREERPLALRSVELAAFPDEGAERSPAQRPQTPAWKDLLSEFTWLEPRCSINLAEFHEP